MNAPQALQVNGEYCCPVDGCSARYKLPNSLHKRCRDVHEIRVQCKQKPYDRESRKKQNREASQRFQDKKSCEKAMKAVKSRTKLFTYEDADRRGGHMQKDALLKVEISQIPDAGNGVFACEDLQVDDIVTWYAGRKVKQPPQDPTYAIQAPGGYLDGVRRLTKGIGLGSFINSEQRERRLKKNCVFVACGAQQHAMYAEITKDVKKGEELFTTCGRSYRIPK